MIRRDCLLSSIAIAVLMAAAPAEAAQQLSAPQPVTSQATQPVVVPPVPEAPATATMPEVASPAQSAPLEPAPPSDRSVPQPAATPPPEPVGPAPGAATQAATPPAAAQNDIVVSARVATPTDPLVKLNEKSFEAIQSVDKAFVGPVAMGYKKGMPKPIRLGLRNFLRNLDEPVSAVNFLLQLKPVSAVKSVARFAVNSTVGVAGLIDVAKKEPFNLPYRPNGFANTFACYGVGSGPFLFLPLVGPITVRDLVGLGLDKAFLPAIVGPPLNKSYYAIPAGVIDSLNDRIEMDAQIQNMRENASDTYVANRELYLKQRAAELSTICPKRFPPPPASEALPPRVGKGVD